jgi:hypothetical protein
VLCYRAVDTTADEEGGGRDEKYEINSMGEPSGTGLLEMVAMVSQHTRTKKNPAENGREMVTKQ